MIDVRLGPWQTALRSIEEVDAAVVDAGYSERVHRGNKDVPDRGKRKTEMGYSAMGPEDIREWSEHWSPRVRGWVIHLTSHDLYPVWRSELERAGRYCFAPVPVVDRGMAVRRQGDGPSSWTVWLLASRPRTRAFIRSDVCSTKPGEYRREHGDPRSPRKGGKPLGVMREIIRDYTMPGDLVLDTHAGGGTTLVAAAMEGRHAVGAEADWRAWDALIDRCRRPC